MARTIDAPVRPGDILAAKYRVERVLGAGSMGIVVAATHVDLGQRVALKFMLAEKGAKPEHRERFLREARAAGRLRSQHVARVLDVGTLENGAPYIVMEFLEGQDLSTLLKERGPLPFEEAVEYVLQACEAVGEAHAAGVVHRDLKPANLFLIEDVNGAPCIKVLDFGISKLSGVEFALTHDAEMLGSPLYMSPEQMRSSRGVDARSDVWSLGVVLYQLVAGKTPFDAETLLRLVSRVTMGEPTPLAAYRTDAQPGFEAVLLGCFARDREQRWPDVASFAAALTPYAPEHMRAASRRAARVLGKTAAISRPELSVAAPTVHTLPLATLRAAPRAAALSASSVVSETAITLSSSQKDSRRAAPPGTRAWVGVALGVIALGVGALGTVGVRRALRPSPAALMTAEPPAAAFSSDPAAARGLAPLPEVPLPVPFEEPAARQAPSAPTTAEAAPRASAASKAPKPAAGARAAAPTSAKPPPKRAPAAPAARPPPKHPGIY